MNETTQVTEVAQTTADVVTEFKDVDVNLWKWIALVAGGVVTVETLWLIFGKKIKMSFNEFRSKLHKKQKDIEQADVQEEDSEDYTED